MTFFQSKSHFLLFWLTGFGFEGLDTARVSRTLGFRRSRTGHPTSPHPPLLSQNSNIVRLCRCEMGNSGGEGLKYIYPTELI
jgi:hypothetical protein